MSTITAFDVPSIAGLPIDQASGPVATCSEDPAFPTVQRLEGQRRQGAGPFPGLLPRGDGPRRRHAAGEGAGRAGGDAPGRLALRLVPLLDHPQLARGGARWATAARHVRHAPDLRRGPQPGRRLVAEPALPGADPLPAAKRQLVGRTHLPASRVRPAPGRPGDDRWPARQPSRSAALDRRLQREPAAAARAVRHQARDAVAAAGGRGVRPGFAGAV